ncbi:MAG: DUF3515 family protein [Microbacterium sp.]
MPRRSAVLTAVWVLTAGIVLAGCTSTVSLQPAEDANDPACADVTVRLPESVDGESRRWTDAQATGAWGDPASVILTCGVASLGPTTLPCRSVNGVDWVIDESDAPRYRVTTFGRVPAVEVYLDNDVVSSAEVLDRLSQVVSVLPTDGSVCTESGTAG